jgi:hypothetical protein
VPLGRDWSGCAGSLEVKLIIKRLAAIITAHMKNPIKKIQVMLLDALLINGRRILHTRFLRVGCRLSHLDQRLQMEAPALHKELMHKT